MEEEVEMLCNLPKQKPVICNCEVGDLKWRERLVNEAILEYVEEMKEMRGSAYRTDTRQTSRLALVKSLHWLSPIVTFIHFQTFKFQCSQ